MATYWENSCSFGLRYVSWYKNLIVSLVFSHLGFLSGNHFLIAPFPDLCLLVPFHFSWLGLELLVCCLAYRSSTGVSLLLRIFRKILGAQGSPSSGSLLNLQVLVFLIHHGGYHYLFVCP